MVTGNQNRGLSRRTFLQTGVLSAAIGSSLKSFGSTRGEDTRGMNADLLNGATEAARWIRSVERNSEEGRHWLPEPDHPEKKTTVSPENGIYSGNAGVVLFFLELAKATEDPSYLEDARLGADYLATTWNKFPNEKERIPGANLSFYNGLSGVAFVLAETWKATGATKYRDSSLAATQFLADQAKPTGGGIAWSKSPGVIGDGSIILYFLYAARVFNREEYRTVAANGGRRLLEAAMPDAVGGTRWKGVPPELLNLPEETYFPNFELGTAGVAYVLARLHEETGDIQFLNAAKSGALHLQKIAIVQRTGALVPYRYPDLKDVYYLGFCHGPAGTARLFYQLYRITKDKIYLEWTESLARGVINSDIPANQTPGFWNVLCQCCGSAGLTDFFLGLWAATNKTEYFAFANRLAAQALSHYTDFDGNGYRWYQAWTRVKPWEVSAETGYSIGAAGIGAALLHSSLAQKGRYEAILFPDNPFPRSRDEARVRVEGVLDLNAMDRFGP